MRAHLRESAAATEKRQWCGCGRMGCGAPVHLVARSAERRVRAAGQLESLVPVRVSAVDLAQPAQVEGTDATIAAAGIR
jgi:short-subunit dehydrogenase